MEDEHLYYDDFIINLTIDGTSFEEVEVRVSNPNKSIREQIESIIKVFELPETDSCGTPIHYILGIMLEDHEESEILELEDADGHEQSMIDYGIQPGDSLHLFAVPAYACPIPANMEKDFIDDEFIIRLTIDGTSYEDIEVTVTDPNKTIRNQIDRIIQVFELPKLDCGGNPIQYRLGKMIEEDEEPDILYMENEDGCELCLMDYNILPGDNLHLFACPIAGYACPVPNDMEKLWKDYYLNNE